MVFGKKDHLVGLDIGSSAIKACEIIDTKKGKTLKKLGITNLATSSIEDGFIANQEEVSNTIKKLFKTEGIKEENVALSVGGYSVIVKKINVQQMSDSQLVETISFEAEQYIPYDINEVNLDFQILGESDVNPNQISVLLVAAKKEMIAEYINVVKLAGLNPVIIDVDAFALQNIYEINYAVDNNNIALIDIGATKTSLNIMRGNLSVFMRDVSLGCGQINQKIMSIVNCSYEEAENLKLGNKLSLNKFSKDNIKEITASITSDWCTEIRRAIDYFSSTNQDNQIQKIVLSGGGANIDYFRQILAAETSAEIEIINPFKNIDIDSYRFELSHIQKIAPQISICAGLALRKIDDK